MGDVLDSNSYRCLMCQRREKRVVADTVATAADGLQWFECSAHEPTDNIAGTTRVHSENIEVWRTRHGIVSRTRGPSSPTRNSVSCSRCLRKPEPW